jgi:hypothetical protein
MLAAKCLDDAGHPPAQAGDLAVLLAEWVKVSVSLSTRSASACVVVVPDPADDGES